MPLNSHSRIRGRAAGDRPSRPSRRFLSGIALLLGGVPASGAVLLVPEDHPTVQGAVIEAASGDTVRISPGTYLGKVEFQGRPVWVTSTDPENPEIVSTTVLSTEGQGTVLIFSSNEDRHCVVAGLTISGGYAPTGGGASCRGASPTLAQLRFLHNTADLGGAIFTSDGSPRIRDCQIINNRARSGGAMAFFGGAPWVERSTLEKNLAHYGGAIALRAKTSPTFQNLRIHHNGAKSAGGAIHAIGAWAEIENCVIHHNGSLNTGGAIWASRDANLKFRHSTLADNIASFAGGAVDSDLAVVQLYNSILWGDEPHEFSPLADTVYTHWCDVDGGSSGEGDLDLDPLFFDYGPEDYLLKATSPAIDRAEEGEDGLRWCNFSLDYCAANTQLADLGAYGGPGSQNWLPPVPAP